MDHCKPLAILIVVVFVSWLFAPWPGSAGPAFPSGPTINDEILSLVGVQRAALRVHVRQPRDAEAIDIPITLLEKELTRVCAEEDVEIDATIEGVRIAIAVEFHPNPDHPEMMSYIAHLALEQEMHLDRLERTMTVPTYTLIDGGFYEREHIAAQVSRNIRAMMRRFLQHHELAQRKDR